jgi:hypothetical protein
MRGRGHFALTLPASLLRGTRILALRRGGLFNVVQASICANWSSSLIPSVRARAHQRSNARPAQYGAREYQNLLELILQDHQQAQRGVDPQQLAQLRPLVLFQVGLAPPRPLCRESANDRG